MRTGFIYINENVIGSLLALSSEEQEKGLMFEPFPPPVMSFVYLHPRVNKFWMKNTPSPLDIIFSNKNKITQICKGEPYSTSTIGNNSLSDLIVEFPYGSAKDLNIKVGDTIEIVKPTYSELVQIMLGKFS